MIHSFTVNVHATRSAGERMVTIPLGQVSMCTVHRIILKVRHTMNKPILDLSNVIQLAQNEIDKATDLREVIAIVDGVTRIVHLAIDLDGLHRGPCSASMVNHPEEA